MSLSKNDIITELYLSNEFNDCIDKQEPPYLRDELKSEVILALLEKPDEIIQSLYYDKANGAGLKFFAVRIILNLIRSKTSPFFKKYRIAMEEYNPNERYIWD